MEKDWPKEGIDHVCSVCKKKLETSEQAHEHLKWANEPIEPLFPKGSPVIIHVEEDWGKASLVLKVVDVKPKGRHKKELIYVVKILNFIRLEITDEKTYFYDATFMIPEQGNCANPIAAEYKQITDFRPFRLNATWLKDLADELKE